MVAVIDTANLSVANQVRLPGEDLRPMDVKTSPDGARLYVTTGRGKQLVALDATSLSQVGSVEVGARPWGLGVSPDGSTLYTANGPSNDVSVIDARTMAVTATLPAGTGPWGVAVVAAK
jgi:YVTN family beta-propeller protein